MRCTECGLRVPEDADSQLAEQQRQIAELRSELAKWKHKALGVPRRRSLGFNVNSMGVYELRMAVKEMRPYVFAVQDLEKELAELRKCSVIPWGELLARGLSEFEPELGTSPARLIRWVDHLMGRAIAGGSCETSQQQTGRTGGAGRRAGNGLGSQ